MVEAGQETGRPELQVLAGGGVLDGPDHPAPDEHAVPLDVEGGAAGLGEFAGRWTPIRGSPRGNRARNSPASLSSVQWM
ncbi:hypothetical protein [Streptomyces canus]|uniref:hypothetical protein n=1 Tax=Streptomyces canus TaxID=58343 RepID=UPI00277DC86E|nr:hypothetical protein [Streptomyces canus]MDQ0759564.1 hypothetical protein [Streptomyces canus]MDQ1071806.1 hypothetical protein [Streptomyces canus]